MGYLFDSRFHELLIVLSLARARKIIADANDYEKLECAIKEMDLGFLSVSDFIDEQIKNALEKYGEWKEQTEENEKISTLR